MRGNFRCLVVLCLAALVGFPASAAAQGKPSTVLFTGGELGPNWEAVWSGAIVALNGDLTRDGVVVRGIGAYVWYDYIGGVGNTKINGELPLFDAMIGYQFVRPNLRVTAYVGAEWQRHDLTPDDPFNSVSGRETGFKTLLDISANSDGPLVLDALASYSTAFETWWGRLRIGYKFDQITIGPEGYLAGNQEGDAKRVGGFIKFSPTIAGVPTFITFASGYVYGDGNTTFSNSGTYGSLDLAIVF